MKKVNVAIRAIPKPHTATMRIGDVKTTFTWDGVRKRPTVTYSKAAFIVPEYGKLDSVITDEEMQR